MLLERLQRPDGYEWLLAQFPKWAAPHPFVPVPSREALVAMLRKPDGEERLHAFFEGRGKALENEQKDPFRHACKLKPWIDADRLLLQCMLLACLGGNRAGKTEYGAFTGMHKAAEKAGANILWLHESDSSSVGIQQKAVYKYLPEEWRDIKKGQITNILYSVKNGFSDNKFVLPNGSVGMFGSYKQDIKDYEGFEYDLVVADENLPLAWLRTLMVRLATRAGRFIWSFTPIHGITPTLKEIVEGAVTVESRPVDPALLDPQRVHVDDCPPGHMPYIQKSTLPDTSVIYFHSDLNPYSDYVSLRKILLRFETEDRKRRGYGYARNTMLTLFPMFSAFHVIEELPEGDYTRYHFADPAGARNMFQLWVAVDLHRRHFVYREWPDISRYGEWASPSENPTRWDGDPGPGQPTLGFGVLEYKRQILADEGKETIEQRYMDPRSGAAAAITEDKGGQSLMDRFREEQFNERKELVGPMMDFLPAPGLREDEGVQAINDLLSYNRHEPIVALMNEPKLFVLKRCQNLIWALKNYTGHDGEKAACKDPIDDLRYMATQRLDYLDPKRKVSFGGGSY
jgi:hypothetical protein